MCSCVLYVGKCRVQRFSEKSKGIPLSNVESVTRRKSSFLKLIPPMRLLARLLRSNGWILHGRPIGRSLGRASAAVGIVLFDGVNMMTTLIPVKVFAVTDESSGSKHDVKWNNED